MTYRESLHFKRVAKPAAPQWLSVVTAVKQYGDNWNLGVLPAQQVQETLSKDDLRDYVAMTLMERGVIGRVQP